MTAPNTNVIRAGQSLTPGDLVALYVIDLTPIKIPQQFAFTPNSKQSRGGPLVYRGVQYQPLDVKCEGFEMTGQGSLPTPKISISNVTRVISSAAILFKDLIGARLIRTRTYAQFLDDGATPDTEAAYAQDVYSFDQKTVHNKRMIQWTLASAMDQEGRMLPGRQVIRDVCLFRYRRWDPNTGSFDYSHVKCPYTGGQSYDRDGNPVAASADDPSRRIDTCCKVRFGQNAYLPFGGFPGVARVRV